ncbi:glycoside hydrolase family 43 protein [Sphaerobolus stellatus SS14]|nr:glycoside hydrolase family 43 protein [Sphaerobolus stellatus SS14]
MKSLLYFVALLAPLVTRAQVNPGKVTGDVTVADPSLCKDNSGKYFLFSTAPGIEIRTSTDRTAWTLAGTVWSSGQATWTNQYTGTSNGNLWAPDCQYINGQFYLYYAASSFGSQNSAIFFAKSSTELRPRSGSWTNEGLVTSSSSSNNYNAIDPNLIVDTSGAWHLTLGSFWTGIKQFPLSSSTGKPSSSSIVSLAQRTANNGAIEAGYIFHTNGFYYLFTSWDNCCQGTSSTYNIRVVRSTSVTGPFADQSGVAATAGGGTLVLGSHGSIIGPGGQSVFLDSDAPILVYHYYTSTSSLLGINRLNFTSGWPVVY